MRDYTEEIDELLEQAADLELGPAKVALIEEAVRLADLHNDVEAGFNSRLDLIDAAAFAGRPDLELVTFSWCLSQCDRDPEQFPESELLWKYKWIITAITEFPQVSREQIEKMLADLIERFERAGSTLHAVGSLRLSVGLDLGDRAMVEAGHKHLKQTRRDWLSDCQACVADRFIDYHVFLGEYPEAVAVAKSILKGRQSCGEVPQRTYAKLLEPLLRIGRLEEAMGYHLKGYRMIARNPEFIGHLGRHIIFLALTENFPRAVKMLERHLPAALATPSLDMQFDFYRAGRLLLERLQETGRQQVRLRLPEALPQGERGRIATDELAGWFRAQCLDLAARFNARNGNDWFSHRLDQDQELKTLATPHPVSTSSSE